MACKGFAVALLFIINVIFAAAGLLMLAFGIAAAAKPDSVVDIFSYAPGVIEKSMKAGFNLEETIKSSAVFMIILGAVVSVMGLFGCIGACCKVRWMLSIYIGALIVILLAEVALIIYAAVFPGHLETNTRPLMLKSLLTYKNDGAIQNGSYIMPTDETDLAWASLQFEAGCCGANGYMDYNNVSFTTAGFASINSKIPVSCCKLNDGPGRIPHVEADFENLNQCLQADTKYINEKDCFTAVEDLLKQYSRIAIGIAAAIIAIEIILILLAMYIYRSITFTPGTKSQAI